MFTAFTAGFSIMSLELAASRVLAPGFGGSVYVWGALIGVIMAALSVGYYLGGKRADERNDVRDVFRNLLYAAVYAAFIPLVGRPVVMASIYGGLILGPIAATVLLFVAPLTLLSMTSPMVIKFHTRDLEDVGGSAGLVYAVSTVGSIFGTFATAFMLLPWMGTRATLLANAAALFLVAAVGLWNKMDSLMFMFLVPGLLITQPAPDNLVYRTESAYNVISVYDYPTHRILKTNQEVFFLQTYMNKEGVLTGRYYDAYAVGPEINGGENILFLGMAGGTAVKQLLHFHDVNVDAVEIDPKVVEVAEDYFGVEEGERLRVYNMDARMFIRQEGRYDIVDIDVFHGADIPVHLATVEFFQEVDDHLTEDGVVMMNVVTARNDTGVSDAIAYTLQQVYPSVFTIDFGGNTMLMASKRRMTVAEVRERLEDADPRLKDVASKVSAGLEEFNSADGVLLSDDKSRIEELTFSFQRKIL